MKIAPLDWKQTIPIRHRVLWPDKPPEFCHVKGDEDAFHFGLFVKNGEVEQLVSVASIFISDDSARLRKFATLPEFQGRGFGTALLTHAIDVVQKKGIGHFWCDARSTATGFYAQFGLEMEGEVFTKSGLPYIKMSTRLGASHSLDNA